MFLETNVLARCLVKWIIPDLEAVYEYVSIKGTCKPSMDAILTTRDGLSEVPFFSSKDVSCWVKKKGDFKFKSTTLSQPDSGN